MHKFSKNSQIKLITCDKRLQAICNELLEEMDITVICGFRDEYAQDDAYFNGHSKLQWPKSKHNTFPSQAVDIAPFPIDWNDIERFKDMGDKVKQIASRLGIDITWGGDWKMRDYPHIEIKG